MVVPTYRDQQGKLWLPKYVLFNNKQSDNNKKLIKI